MLKRIMTLVALVMMLFMCAVLAVTADPIVIPPQRPPDWLAIGADFMQIAIGPLLILLYRNINQLRKELRDEIDTKIKTLHDAKEAIHSDLYKKIDERKDSHQSLEIFIRDHFIQRRDIQNIIAGSVQPLEGAIRALTMTMMSSKEGDK